MSKHSINKKIFHILLGTSISVAGISLMNKLIFHKAVKKDYLFTEKKLYYKWRYGNVYYTVKGEGKPLLLVHGIGSGTSSHTFKEVSNQLAKNHRVYEIDLLGFGRSDKPKLTYTAFLYVQLISDFIENVIKKPTNIIASSLSSSFAIMCCYHNNELFNRIMLINPLDLNTLNKYPNKMSNISRKLLETPLIGTTIYNMLCSKYYIRKFLKDKCFFNKNKVSKKLVNLFYESAHLNGPSAKFAVASFLTKYMNTDIKSALASIDNSIYILWSKDNEFSNRPIIEQYLTLNPSIEYSVIDDTKLLPHLEKPKDFLSICHIFFG